MRQKLYLFRFMDEWNLSTWQLRSSPKSQSQWMSELRFQPRPMDTMAEHWDNGLSNLLRASGLWLLAMKLPSFDQFLINTSDFQNTIFVIA